MLPLEMYERFKQCQCTIFRCIDDGAAFAVPSAVNNDPACAIEFKELGDAPEDHLSGHETVTRLLEKFFD